MQSCRARTYPPTVTVMASTSTRKTGDAGPTGGLRERKRRETHRALAAAALELVAERGLEQVTVDEISAAVGVSPRTFFNYFATKEDAVLLPYPDHAERAERAALAVLSAPDGPTPLHTVTLGWQEEMERVQEDQDEWLVRLTVLEDHPPLISRLVALEAESERRLTAAIARRTGCSPEDAYPTLLYCVADAAMYACLLNWHRLHGARPLGELVQEAVEAVAAGLPAPSRTGPR